MIRVTLWVILLAVLTVGILLSLLAWWIVHLMRGLR